MAVHISNIFPTYVVDNTHLLLTIIKMSNTIMKSDPNPTTKAKLMACSHSKLVAVAKPDNIEHSLAIS